ncbi:hypothetical protein [Novosphingobium aquimarinum]|uniref:hypothetical protein n=1 Tax=Novosphingobium aquimarinum TaxID=2682494 RepID=UPI0012EBE7A6|nr:hypothetical protein [Novosphingobium aquimarinum]
MLNLPYIDRIWTARGSIPLEPPRTPKDTFLRLDPLLDAAGTHVEIDGDTLTYVKDNPAAQDKLATFSRGTLRVVQEQGNTRLRYKLTSPALLLVFLAPFLFLAIAQATVFLIDYERHAEEKKAAEGKDKAKDKKKEKEPGPLNAIDQFLGAPAPETLAEKKKREKEEGTDKHTPKPAYILSGIFAVLYLFGRWFEPFLMRRTLRRVLNGQSVQADHASADRMKLNRPN